MKRAIPAYQSTYLKNAIYKMANLLNRTNIFMAIFLVGFSLMASAANAENAVITDMPSVSQNASMDSSGNTHPTMRITMDKSEMVTLEKEAASVIVGNPNHISVLLDTPTSLVVVPRTDGASHFSVVGKDGTIIMQRHVIVGAAKEQYVRIRRSCNPNSRNCQAISTYYCPDMCHEVSENNTQPRR
jgi:Flp pilus assembly secretin CpaC